MLQTIIIEDEVIEFYICPGVNTNKIEAAWMWAKAFMKNRKVTSDVSLHLHLQCYMWRVWKGRPHADGCFGRLLEDIATLFPQT